MKNVSLKKHLTLHRRAFIIMILMDVSLIVFVPYLLKNLIDAPIWLFQIILTFIFILIDLWWLNQMDKTFLKLCNDASEQEAYDLANEMQRHRIITHKTYEIMKVMVALYEKEQQK